MEGPLYQDSFTNDTRYSTMSFVSYELIFFKYVWLLWRLFQRIISNYIWLVLRFVSFISWSCRCKQYEPKMTSWHGDNDERLGYISMKRIEKYWNTKIGISSWLNDLLKVCLNVVFQMSRIKCFLFALPGILFCYFELLNYSA